jgi:hypothetical protein
MQKLRFALTKLQKKQKAQKLRLPIERYCEAHVEHGYCYEIEVAVVQ